MMKLVAYGVRLQQPTTKVELNDEDARLFVAFREHQDIFKALLDAGVFDMKNGQAILSFSHTGHLMKIEKNLVAYVKQSVV